MKAGGSKAKGNAFERSIAKQLAVYFYNDPDALVRNFNSGGLATMRKGAGLTPGDITQVKYLDKPLQFSIECKFHKKFNINDLLIGNTKSTLYKAWVQCARDAKTLDKIPMLVFKQNFGEPYVVFYHKDLMLAPLMSYKHFCKTTEFIIVSLKHLLEDTDKFLINYLVNYDGSFQR